MPSANHNHRYLRQTFKSGAKIFKCEKEGCSHSVHPNMLVGRTAECGRCYGTFIIKPRDKKWARPVCDDCKGSPTSLDEKTARDNALEKLLEGE